MKFQRMRPLIKNKQAEVYYRNALNNELQRFLDKVFKEVEKNYTTIKVENAKYQSFKNPKKPTLKTFERLIKFIKDNWEPTLLENSKLITIKFINKAFVNILKSSRQQLLKIGVASALKKKDFEKYIQLVIKNNVSLIQNITQQTVNNIESIITNSMVNGQPYSEIYKQLKHQEKIVGERVNLIADDQINKFNEAVNRFQQEDAGVEYFEWWGMDDARERPAHTKLNGKIFKWGDVKERLPIIDEKGTRGYPAEAVRCRCTALAYIPDAEFDGEYKVRWKGDNEGYEFIEIKK